MVMYGQKLMLDENHFRYTCSEYFFQDYPWKEYKNVGSRLKLSYMERKTKLSERERERETVLSL